MSKIVISIISFFVGVVLRTLAPLAVDWVQARVVAFAVQRKWRLGSRSRLGGDWHHVWYAKDSPTWPDENQCVIALSAIGRRFAGVYNYMERDWLVEGVLGADNIVTGTWRELSANKYRGTWIGKVDLNLQTIAGWYLGTSNRGPTGVGEWIWWRDGAIRPPLPEPLVQPAPRIVSSQQVEQGP
jgi:hypothetical protein